MCIICDWQWSLRFRDISKRHPLIGRVIKVSIYSILKYNYAAHGAYINYLLYIGQETHWTWPNIVSLALSVVWVMRWCTSAREPGDFDRETGQYPSDCCGILVHEVRYHVTCLCIGGSWPGSSRGYTIFVNIIILTLCIGSRAYCRTKDQQLIGFYWTTQIVLQISYLCNIHCCHYISISAHNLFGNNHHITLNIIYLTNLCDSFSGIHLLNGFLFPKYRVFQKKVPPNNQNTCGGTCHIVLLNLSQGSFINKQYLK
jgi:hypothetical protein